MNHQQYRIKLVSKYGANAVYHLVERNFLRATKTSIKLAREKTKCDSLEWGVRSVESVEKNRWEVV